MVEEAEQMFKALVWAEKASSTWDARMGMNKNLARPARLERATCGFEDLTSVKFGVFFKSLILVRFSRNFRKIRDKFKFVRFLSIPVYSIHSDLFELILAQI